MMKKLAKLRQFREGMDVEEYLSTELRQNWLAIEQALKAVGVKISDVIDGDGKTITAPGTIVFSASKIGTLSPGAISMTKDVDAFVVDDAGTWNGFAFIPKEDAVYSVEIGFMGTVLTDSTGAVNASIIQIVKSGVVENSASYSLKTQNGAPVITGTGAATAKAIMKLTTANAVYFNFIALFAGGTATAQNFYCEIKKIS